MGFDSYNNHNDNSIQKPWTNISLQNGWTGVLRYKNFMGLVFLNGEITPGIVTNGTTVGTMLNSCPNIKISLPVSAQDTGTTSPTLDSAKITIETNGTVRVYGFGALANSPVSINFSWIM